VEADDQRALVRRAHDHVADRGRLVVHEAELGLERRVVEGAGADETDLLLRREEELDAFAFAASVAECTLETEVSETYQGYRFKETDSIVQLARTALERCGYELVPTLTGGGADANVFNMRGLPCLNLANGMAAIHTAEEHIAVDDLESMVDVSLALVDAARDATQP